MTFVSKAKADSTAALSSETCLTLVVPRLEPLRAGLTNSGYLRLLGRSKLVDVTTVPGATFNPAAAKIGFAYDLSMLTALASTPEPT